MDECIDGWDGRIDGWMAGWMDIGLMDIVQTYHHKFHSCQRFSDYQDKQQIG